MPVPFVLASASPARLSTLRAAGIEATVIVSHVDEERVLAHAIRDATVVGKPLPDHAAEALLLARTKAEVVAGESGRGSLVLGCDSVLEFEGASLGKPGDPGTARDRWRAMRGRSGVLHSGHWLVDARGGVDVAHPGENGFPAVGEVSSTLVRFGDLSDAEIDAYVATGEPLGVAGGFTIDGLGGPFIEGIDGDHHGVVGLSLPLLRRLLGELGLTIPDLWPTGT
jgi:septum formation protein